MRDGNPQIAINAELDLVLLHIKPSFWAENMRIGAPQLRMPTEGSKSMVMNSHEYKREKARWAHLLYPFKFA